MSCDCGPIQYALVAYVKSELGEFVEDLRRELHPVHAHLPTHLTVLPPRPLHGSEDEAVAMLRKLSAPVAPFEVELGEVDSFHPGKLRRIPDARVTRSAEPQSTGLH